MWLAAHGKSLLGTAEDAWPLIAGVVGAIVTVTGWVLARMRRTRAAVTEDELGQVADRLAKDVEDQWTRGASERGLLRPKPIPVRWRRPTSPLAVRAADAADSDQFEPLPGLAAATPERLQEGQLDDLHELYGGLRSGQLVIAGAPGSGKSGAAVLLILRALDYRKSKSVPEKDRPQVPVPVMFTLQGWDPKTERVEVWLVGRLRQDYPLLFAGKRGKRTARDMLIQGKVAVILDGLDEIPEDLRPAALEALSQQATFRLVLLTRSAEMAAAAAKAVLLDAAAIELQDIDAADAAAYLARTQPDRPSDGWQKLIDRLRDKPRSPLAHALNNPLMLTLVRDTYRPGDDVGELLHLRNAAGRSASGEDIVGHLLDRVLLTAYTQRPGESPPPYSLGTAQHALGQIATRMNRDGTRDLPWWKVPEWANSALTFLTTFLAIGIVVGLAGMLLPTPSLAWCALLGATAGLAAGTASIFINRIWKGPKQIAQRWWRQLFHRRALRALGLSGLLGGLYCGLLVGFFGTGDQGGLAVGLKAGLGTGLASGLAVWLVVAITRAEEGNTKTLGPLDSWRNDLRFGLVIALVVAFGFALFTLTLTVVASGKEGPGAAVSVEGALATAFWIALMSFPATSKTWSSALGFAQLARSDRTPFHLMRFLEDAHKRNVLRTVGPVYQFRHARLQDRLAGQDPAAAKGRNEMSRQASTRRGRVQRPKPTAEGSVQLEAAGQVLTEDDLRGP